MSNFTIQEQFDTYMEILREIHTIGHEIDASVDQTEIEKLEEKRNSRRNKMYRVVAELTGSLKALGTHYPVKNYLSGKTTYIYEEAGHLMFRFT